MLKNMEKEIFRVLKASPSRNLVDDLTDALVNNMRYSDNTVEYPNIDEVRPDDGVIAEWFYPIYNGTNDFSELTAILMYTSQETSFEEIGELMLGIGLTEMKHYAKLGDLIKGLGGRIDEKYDNSGVTIGSTPREALKLAYDSELVTIEFYEKLERRIEKVKTTKTTVVALQLISKLIADEKVHLALLKEEIAKEFTKEEETARDKLKELENE